MLGPQEETEINRNITVLLVLRSVVEGCDFSFYVNFVCVFVFRMIQNPRQYSHIHLYQLQMQLQRQRRRKSGRILKQESHL